ncbi:restriction endonuclease subunit S, partial [Picosynechococcus sp. PCC 7002]|uniref:restriction endonuclease subunit S n=1 Tax=Picosynechococcus sp. (strain ATCC 27264 / PCC 7002 / PR-6) TaxID=32049 RepID=UPI001C3D2B0B
RVCLGQRTVLIRPKENINPQYLAFFLLHTKMQERLLSKSSGATVQHVNMKDIIALKMGDLPPIEIQYRLIESLLDVQEKSKKLEEVYQRKIEALGKLKQSIL